MASVTFDRVSRTYPGADRPSVAELDLHIGDGEFLVLVGPSGCGKSTTLRMLAGLEEVDSGRVLIGNDDVTTVPPKDRDIAMVFQNYALYPHMTVAENMGFALKIAGVPTAQRAEQVREVARLLDLEPLLDRKPKALSGGQRQRVAMGRAIVRQPQVFLMDEPLSNLDAKLRVQTRTQIASLQRRLGVTTVYVTHDQTEALTMGDRIAVLAEGSLQQVGTPRELYETPKNVFVASFIGSPAMNLMPSELTPEGVRFGTLVVPVAREIVEQAPSRAVTVGVRPEDLALAAPGDPGLQVVVDLVEELGADGYLYGHTVFAGGADSELGTGGGLGAESERGTGGRLGTAVVVGEDGGGEAAGAPGVGNRIDIVARVDGRDHPVAGETVTLVPAPGHLHLFDALTGDRLAERTASPTASSPTSSSTAAPAAAD